MLKLRVAAWAEFDTQVSEDRIKPEIIESVAIFHKCFMINLLQYKLNSCHYSVEILDRLLDNVGIYISIQVKKCFSRSGNVGYNQKVSDFYKESLTVLL